MGISGAQSCCIEAYPPVIPEAILPNADVVLVAALLTPFTAALNNFAVLAEDDSDDKGGLASRISDFPVSREFL